MSKYIECTNCGALLEEDEISFQESGSLHSEPVNLCDACDVNLHGPIDEGTVDGEGWGTIFDDLEYWS